MDKLQWGKAIIATNITKGSWRFSQRYNLGGFIGLLVTKIFNKILVSEDDKKHLSMVCTLPSLTYHKEQAVYVTESELYSLTFKNLSRCTVEEHKTCVQNLHKITSGDTKLTCNPLSHNQGREAQKTNLKLLEVARKFNVTCAPQSNGDYVWNDYKVFRWSYGHGKTFLEFPDVTKNCQVTSTSQTNGDGVWND